MGIAIGEKIICDNCKFITLKMNNSHIKVDTTNWHFLYAFDYWLRKGWISYLFILRISQYSQWLETKYTNENMNIFHLEIIKIKSFFLSIRWQTGHNRKEIENHMIYNWNFTIIIIHILYYIENHIILIYQLLQLTFTNKNRFINVSNYIFEIWFMG